MVCAHSVALPHLVLLVYRVVNRVWGVNGTFCKIHCLDKHAYYRLQLVESRNTIRLLREECVRIVMFLDVLVLMSRDTARMLVVEQNNMGCVVT
jgi:hypothetical protein